MGVLDDQIKWRTVFCGEPSFLHATTYPSAGAAHTVVQSDPTKLLCTTTPSAITAQKVIQSDASLLKMTNTPDGTNSQLIHLSSGIKGIWPPEGTTRVHGHNIQAGSGTTIVYTVPASKKLYIHSVEISMRTSADGATSGRMGVRDSGDNFKYYVFYPQLIITGAISLSEHYSPALELLTGYDLYLMTAEANVTLRGLFHGWLEDV